MEPCGRGVSRDTIPIQSANTIPNEGRSRAVSSSFDCVEREVDFISMWVCIPVQTAIFRTKHARLAGTNSTARKRGMAVSTCVSQ